MHTSTKAQQSPCETYSNSVDPDLYLDLHSYPSSRLLQINRQGWNHSITSSLAEVMIKVVSYIKTGLKPEKAHPKKRVFQSYLKDGMAFDWQISSGRLFQTAGSLTEWAVSPLVLRRDCGMACGVLAQVMTGHTWYQNNWNVLSRTDQCADITKVVTVDLTLEALELSSCLDFFQ